MPLGPEIVVDGGFDNPEAWDLAGGCRIEDGKLFMTGESPTPDASQLHAFKVGTPYRVSFEISEYQASTVVPTSGSFRIGMGSNPVYDIDRDGLYDFELTPTDAYQLDSFQFWAKMYDPEEYFCTYKVDNVSIREVLSDEPEEPAATDDSILTEIEKRAIAVAMQLKKADGTPVFNNLEVVDGVCVRKTGADGKPLHECVAHWAGQISLADSGKESFERYAPFAFFACHIADANREGDDDANLPIAIEVTIGQADDRDYIARIGASDKIGLNRIFELVFHAFDHWHPGKWISGDDIACDEFRFKGAIITCDHLKRFGIQLHFEANWIALA